MLRLRLLAVILTLITVVTLSNSAPGRANGVGTVYATSARGTVIEFAPNSNAVVDEIKSVGAGPLAFAPDGAFLYIANGPADALVIFSIDDLVRAGSVPVSGGPVAVTTLLGRPEVYVGTASGAVVVIDPKIKDTVARVELNSAVVGLVANAAGTQLAVVLSNSNLVLLALPALTVQKRLRLPATPAAIIGQQRLTGSVKTAVSVNTYYWISTQEGNVYAYDSQAAQVARVTLTGALHDVALTGSGDTLVVAGEAGVVYFVNTTSNELLGQLFLRGPVTSLAMDPDGLRGYAAVPSLGQLITFSLEKRSLLAAINSTDNPERLAAAPLKLQGSRVSHNVLPHTATAGGR